MGKCDRQADGILHCGAPCGLANGNGEGDNRRTLKDRLTLQFGADIPALDNLWQQEIKLPETLSAPPLKADAHHPFFSYAFFTRMLYSCLVDADYLDTEAFYLKLENKASERGSSPDLNALQHNFNQFINKFRRRVAQAPAQTEAEKRNAALNRLRSEILDYAVEQAAQPQGLFTLTVPTGGGKTFTSMAFALEHAKRHGMRRVIYVIPFTSIIEQNAAEFRKAFGELGEQAVLEYHSTFDDGKLQNEATKDKLRLASENWDAPIPEMKGFSRANLLYMRAFAEAWTDFEIVQQSVGQLPWGHNVLLLNRIKEQEARLFYVQKAIAENWSRTTLEVHIKNRLHERQGKAVTNFAARLPAPTSALAQETLKDPYLFDFLSLGEDVQEREIENALMQHITRFLLELGNGFAFVGRQYRLEVNGDEFFIDLLFYHIRLKCYVVVELKATAFKPEHAGQLNFYLAAVDAQIKAPDDHATIGLLLCKTQNRLVAEYALSGIGKPIGIAEYELVRALPEPLVTNLPTVEQLENELSDWQEAKDELSGNSG